MKSWFTTLIIDGHHVPVVVDPDAKWIEIKDQQPCPDCQSARRASFALAFRQFLKQQGEEAYRDGLADSEEPPT